jgi:hypothetical protein
MASSNSSNKKKPTKVKHTLPTTGNTTRVLGNRGKKIDCLVAGGKWDPKKGCSN